MYTHVLRCFIYTHIHTYIYLYTDTHALYVFMPHFLTLSSFSTATPRVTSSLGLFELWFDDPKREKEKNSKPCNSIKVHTAEIYRTRTCHDNE